MPEPLLRGVDPLAPPCLLWLLPFEYKRTMQLQADREKKGDTSRFSSFQNIRLQAFVVHVAKFLTTLLLVTFQGSIWLKSYAIFSFPFRLMEGFDVLSALNIDTSTIEHVWSKIKDALGIEQEGDTPLLGGDDDNHDHDDGGGDDGGGSGGNDHGGGDGTTNDDSGDAGDATTDDNIEEPGK